MGSDTSTLISMQFFEHVPRVHCTLSLSMSAKPILIAWHDDNICRF